MGMSYVSQPLSMKTVHAKRKCGLMFRVAAIFLILSLTSCSKPVAYPAPQTAGADIVIDISSLELNVPKFYSYRFQGKDINFFVVKMRMTINAFLDACASCYPHKQGYRCEGDAVICRYCNEKYPIGKLATGLGNCYPIRIEGRVERGKYLISAATLEKSADKF